jgi:hypothetical protein
MGIVNLLGSRIVTGLAANPVTVGDPGEAGGRVRVWTETVEVGAADSATSTYTLARIPSNARILGASRLHYDDLASSGSPTLDIGVFVVRTGDFTSDADALNDGIDAGAANGASVAVIKDKANYGKMVWEFINGQTTDPNCDVFIKVSLLDADVNVGGTMTLELLYVCG